MSNIWNVSRSFLWPGLTPSRDKLFITLFLHAQPLPIPIKPFGLASRFSTFMWSLCFYTTHALPNSSSEMLCFTLNPKDKRQNHKIYLDCLLVCDSHTSSQTSAQIAVSGIAGFLAYLALSVFSFQPPCPALWFAARDDSTDLCICARRPCARSYAHRPCLALPGPAFTSLDITPTVL